MGEVVTMADHAWPGAGSGSGSGYDDRVLEWEDGLPSAADLTPLSQLLVPPCLASAFSIKPEQSRTPIDVDRASRETFSAFRRAPIPTFPENSFKPFDEFNGVMDLTADEDGDGDGEGDGELRKIRRIDSATAEEVKRPRLVWTPQLHRRFVDVVSHLGIKNAVPKTIMQLMNVEGLTRENVASHLQKYRLYLKRSREGGPSLSTDVLFTSSGMVSERPDVGRKGHAAGVPYGSSSMVPVFDHGHHHHHHHHHHAYGMMQQQQRDWSGNSNGSAVSYPGAAPIDNNPSFYI